RLQEAAEHADRRRLAGAVGAQVAEDLAALDEEAHVTDRDERAELAPQRVGLDDVLRCHAASSAWTRARKRSSKSGRTRERRAPSGASAVARASRAPGRTTTRRRAPAGEAAISPGNVESAASTPSRSPPRI